MSFMYLDPRIDAPASGRGVTVPRRGWFDPVDRRCVPRRMSRADALRQSLADLTASLTVTRDRYRSVL